jgi:hypothetical protein
MSAVASTIFKIRAHSDYISKESNVLSFRKGQPFYALSTDHENGFYFVSTQFAVPFSRNAVNGLVPISYFDKVDLLSKEPKHTHKRQQPPAPQAQKNSHSRPTIILDGKEMPVPIRKQSLTHVQPALTRITNLQVLSQSQNVFTIKVVRTNTMHLINRTTQEFHELAQVVNRTVDLTKLQAHADILVNVERILREALSIESDQIHQFFTPKENEIAGTILRRDSGTSCEPEKEEKKRKNSAFSKILNLFNV